MPRRVLLLLVPRDCQTARARAARSTRQSIARYVHVRTRQDMMACHTGNTFSPNTQKSPQKSLHTKSGQTLHGKLRLPIASPSKYSILGRGYNWRWKRSAIPSQSPELAKLSNVYKGFALTTKKLPLSQPSSSTNPFYSRLSIQYQFPSHAEWTIARDGRVCRSHENMPFFLRGHLQWCVDNRLPGLHQYTTVCI